METVNFVSCMRPLTKSVSVGTCQLRQNLETCLLSMTGIEVRRMGG